MMSEYLIVALVCIFLYRFIYNGSKKPKNFPPGPPKFPIIGSYFFLFLINHKKLYLAIEKLSKIYKSNVIGFFAGYAPAVVANDEKTCREVFFNKDFDGRFDLFATRLRDRNYDLNGIFFTEGDFWQEQRRFTLRNMRDFGFGRRFDSYELEVESEILSIIEMIKSGPKFEYEKEFLKDDGSLLFPNALIGCFGNCFLQVMASFRISREDQEKMYRAGIAAFEFQASTNEYGNVFALNFTWFRNAFPLYSKFKSLRSSSMTLLDFVKEIIDDQLARYESGEKLTFLDTYIEQMKKNSKNKKEFFYDQFLMVCIDFLFPALSGIAGQIAFLIRTLLKRQDILLKIQNEIDEVVGQSRLPNLNDRIHMPYTEATLRESMRYDTLTQSAVGHKALVDTKLGGYDVPKGTYVIANLHAFHHSKETFGDPENFRPERFLDENGKLSIKLDKSLPFGGGRRLCAGETFSRNTMFLGVAALLQSFNIKSDKKIIEENIVGLTQMPCKFWAKMVPR